MNRAGFILFENDTIIYPRESSQFGEIGENGKIIPIFDTNLYKYDKIGLKSLHENGKLYLRTMPAKNHMEYTDKFFYENMLPIIFDKKYKA